MTVAVAGDLVMLLGDPANETRMSGRHLPENEEGRLGASRGQQREDPVGAHLHTAFETGDRAADPLLKDSGVEVLLHVDAQRIEDVSLRIHRMSTV